MLGTLDQMYKSLYETRKLSRRPSELNDEEKEAEIIKFANANGYLFRREIHCTFNKGGLKPLDTLYRERKLSNFERAEKIGEEEKIAALYRFAEMNDLHFYHFTLYTFSLNVES